MRRAKAFILFFLAGQLFNVQRTEAAMIMWLRCRGDLLDTTSEGNSATGVGFAYGPDRCDTASYAVSLAGTDESYILPPGNIWSSMSNFSFGLQHKSSRVAGDEVLFSVFASSNPAFLELKVQQTGVVTLTFNGVAMNSASACFTHGSWNQFLVTRNGPTFTIYVNGVEVVSSSLPDTPFPAAVAGNAFVIGQRQTELGVYDQEFSSQSLVSDIRVFDVDLDAIDADRIGRAPGTCAQALQDRPFVHYRLQDAIVHDSANTGYPPYAGVNTGVSVKAAGDGCWDSYFFYLGDSDSITSLTAGPALTGLQDFTVSIWLRRENTKLGAVFSISSNLALPGSTFVQDNELLLMITEELGVEVHQKTKVWDEKNGKYLLDTGLNFVALQREGMLMKLFVNGALVLATKVWDAFPLGSVAVDGFFLGIDQDEVGGGFSNDEGFRGSLSDLQIWGRALTAGEIAGMYDRKCENLVHWWSLNGLETRDRGTDPVVLAMHGIAAAKTNCPGSDSAMLAGNASSYLALDGFKGFKESVTDFTITALFSVTVLTPDVVSCLFSIVIPSNSGALLFGVNSDGYLVFRVQKQGCLVLSATQIIKDDWYSVTVTRRRDVLNIYLNGVHQGSTSGCPNLLGPVVSNGVYVGKSDLGPEYSFGGQILDLRFYNYAFTTIGETSRGHVPSCVAVLNRILHYSLRQGSMNYDRSGNALNLSSPAITAKEELCGQQSMAWEGTAVRQEVDASVSGPFMAGANDFTVSIVLLLAAGGRCFLAVRWAENNNELTCCVDSDANKKIYCRHPTHPDVAYYTQSAVELKATHFALVRDGLQLKFYLDGVLDVTYQLYTQLPFGPIADADSVALGQAWFSAGEYVAGDQWQGAMANWKMWNRALSATEIAEDSTMCQALVGWWRMEGADMTDSSRSRQHGSVAGNVQPGNDSCDRGSKSMDFGGTIDDYASLTNPAYYTWLEDFTLSTWVYPRSLSGHPTLVHLRGSTNDKLLWQLQEDGMMQLTTADAVFVSSSVVIPPTAMDTWHHVAVARSRGTLSFYVAGLVVSTVTCLAEYFEPIVGVVFGGLHNKGHPFNGRLRDFRIYNYGLSHDRGLQGLPSPLACPAYSYPMFRYRMNAMDMYDSSGNSNDGTLDTLTTGEPIMKCMSVPCVGESVNFPGNSAAAGFAAFPAGSLLSGINDFTVSFWVRDLDTSVGGVAINLLAQYPDTSSCDNELMFRRDTGDVLSMFINCEEFRGTEPEFQAGRNIMWTVTRRNREVTVYRNGLFSRSYSHRWQMPIGPVSGSRVGQGSPSDAASAWEGVIADLQFWEGAMTATEVAETYEVAFCDCRAVHTEATSRFALDGRFSETGVIDDGSNDGTFPISRDSVCRGSLVIAAGEQHTLYSTANPSKAFTMALYAKPVSFTSGVRVLLHVGGTEAQQGFGFGVDANNRLVIRDGPEAGGLRTLDVVVETGWRHYVVVYDGEVAAIYIDSLGVHEEVVNLALPEGEQRGRLSVGGVQNDAAGTEGEWAVDEVFLFDGVATMADARSPCDVRAVFSRYTADVESNAMFDYGPGQNHEYGVTSNSEDSVCDGSVKVAEGERHCIRLAREVPQFAEPWTVSAYAKMVTEGDRAFVHLGGDENKTHGFGLGFRQGSVVWSTMSEEWTTVHPASLSGGWHHYAATYDSNAIRFYIDEEEVGTVTYTFDLWKRSEHASMCVGCTRCGDAPEMTYGTWLIDEAVFARGVIPMTELRARCVSVTGPIAMYPMNEDFSDASPAGNDMPGEFASGDEFVCGGSLRLDVDDKFMLEDVAHFPREGEAWTISLYAKRVIPGMRLMVLVTSSWLTAGFAAKDGTALLAYTGGVGINVPDHSIDDDWHHYTMTSNGSTVRLYVDESMVSEWDYVQPDTVRASSMLSIGGDGTVTDPAYTKGEWLFDEVVFGRGVLPHAALRCPSVVSQLPLNGDWNDVGPAKNELSGYFEADDDTVCGGSLRVAPGVTHVYENWKQIPLGAEAWTVSLFAKCVDPGERLLFSLGELASLHTGIGLGVRGTGRLVLQVSSGRYIPLTARKVDRLWHRYTVTYDGSRAEVFVDGVSVFQVDWALSLQSSRFALAAGAAAGKWLFDELMVAHGIVRRQGTSCDSREIFTRYSFDSDFNDSAAAGNNNPVSSLQFVGDGLACGGGTCLQLADSVFYALDNAKKEPGPTHWSLANYAACLKGEAPTAACDAKPFDEVLREVAFCGCSEGCEVFPKGLPQKSEPWTVSLYAQYKEEGNRAFVQLGDVTRALRGFSFGVESDGRLWIFFGGSARIFCPDVKAEGNTWYHYVAYYDSNAVRIWVNGKEKHWEPVVLNLPPCSEMGNLVIGSQLGHLQQDTRRGTWLFDELELGRGAVAYDALRKPCAPPVGQ